MTYPTTGDKYVIPVDSIVRCYVSFSEFLSGNEVIETNPSVTEVDTDNLTIANVTRLSGSTVVPTGLPLYGLPDDRTIGNHKGLNFTVTSSDPGDYIIKVEADTSDHVPAQKLVKICRLTIE